MKRLTISIVVLAAAVIGPAIAKTPTHHAYKSEALAGQAHVSLDQARVIALKARTGRVTDQELEKESGGAGLRYSFDIRSGQRTYEVGVDAGSGAVLENAPEGKNAD